MAALCGGGGTTESSATGCRGPSASRWAAWALAACCAVPAGPGVPAGPVALCQLQPLQALHCTFLSLWFQPALMHSCLPPPALPPAQVLDNGVTSSEFWRILDCAEDLEWCASCNQLARFCLRCRRCWARSVCKPGALGWVLTAAGMLSDACSCALRLCAVHINNNTAPLHRVRFPGACPAALPRMAGSRSCQPVNGSAARCSLPHCPCRCVFYYSGAASRAGLNYSGAILASKSGDWPASQVGRSVGPSVR